MRWLYSIGLVILFLFGCSSAEQFSPEQVMEKAMESEVEETPYYGELIITISDEDDTFEIKSKEWRKGDKSLEEVVTDGEKTISLKDGVKIMVYDEVENTVMETEFAENAELNLSSKKRVENLLELVEDTHTLEKKDDEKIAGRDAMHIVAKKKQGEKSLYGTQEIWIDKENWLVLKSVDKTEDNYSSMEYTKLEMEPDMSDDIFTLDVPDDVIVESLDDMDEEITLEEAEEILGKSFMYFKEDDELTLEEITYNDFSDDESDPMIDFNYHLEGLPYMELSVMKVDEADDLESDEFSEPIDVRGNEGTYIDFEDAHSISWIEGDFQYSIWFINPNIEFEDIEKQVKQMEEIR